MTYFLNVFLGDSPKKPLVLREMKIIKTQKSISFLFGMILAAFLFLLSHSCKERFNLLRLLRFLSDHLDRPAKEVTAESVRALGEQELCCQCTYLEAFLKIYQPEIIATLINVLQMADISLEDYFEALEVRADWPKFQKLMGEVSLMVMEQSRIPEGKSKDAAIFEVRERYIPKLLVAIDTFKATF